MPEANDGDDQATADLLEPLRNATAIVMEHFDSVQIIASRVLGDGSTESASYGSGNWFARVGQTMMWLEKYGGP